MIRWLREWLGKRSLPEHLRRGRLGEAAARRTLRQAGFKILTANYRGGRGELDLVCRDQECLVFVEVKARSSEEWGRAAAAVDKEKRRLVAEAALVYLRRLGNPKVRFRFDVVEVLLKDGAVREVRHLPNAFELPKPLIYC
ncbi:MAG TPA: YraN family protein [Candidatus Limnocylindria bacterium]|jgi:putative endonuclease|nr:YraN family protein [Candidatus Limnocylindria bacterium]